MRPQLSLGVILVGICLVAQAAAGTLEEAREHGFIRLGIANEAPFAYVMSDGSLAGESAEIAKMIFPRLGIPKVVASIVNWKDLIPGLLAGDFDVIAAGMFITPERCQKVLFTEPTYGVGQAFLVKEGNPQGIIDYATVREVPKVTLGLITGAAEQGYAREAGVPAMRIKTFQTPVAAVRAVQDGRIDALGLTTLAISYLVQQAGPEAGVEATPVFAAVEGQSVTGHGAYALRPEDQDLRDAMNLELARFIGSSDHMALVIPYGFGEKTLPRQTAGQLCASAP
ncbi:MAG: ectoine/hydroxyectoine ABC transporter substrate-binding protein EhuB [Magnetospiraceae bacterium]